MVDPKPMALIIFFVASSGSSRSRISVTSIRSLEKAKARTPESTSRRLHRKNNRNSAEEATEPETSQIATIFGPVDLFKAESGAEQDPIIGNIGADDPSYIQLSFALLA